MLNGETAQVDCETDRDSSANKAAVSDHSLTTDFMKSFMSWPDPAEAAIGLFGAHVVEFIGMDKPWRSIGVVAIQSFRPGRPCVYFIGGDDGAIKIGTSIAPLERLATMQMGSPIKLAILALCEGGVKSEREYHARFSADRSHGEWFFRTPEILAEIERLSPTPTQTERT